MAVAAILASIPRDKNGKINNQQYGTAYETILPILWDDGCRHHRKTGAADFSLGKKTIRTKDGFKVAVGVDIKTFAGAAQRGQFGVNLVEFAQKAEFSAYDPTGEPDNYVK